MLTKDNRIILFHDTDTKRLTNERHLIRETGWDDLKDLYIKSRFTNLEKYGYEKIPLLSDVLVNIPDDRMLVIEIKTGNEILPFLKPVIEKYWKTGTLSFISFNYETIVAAKEMFPGIPCYYLLSFRGDLRKRFNDLINSDLDGVDLRHRIIDRKLVNKLNSSGLEVWCWTVNLPEDARKMRDDGVTTVTTDRPKWLKENM